MKQQKIVVKNAVIYARYSSHNQTEQSIEGQLRVCYEYAKREGYTVVGEYIDRAISGRTDDRPDFQRMIDDSRKGAFGYVIVYRLDRFTRNRYDSAVYKHKLKKNGVKVLSAMENIGDNPEGIILEAVLEASAEYYSLELSQKVRRGMRESAMKGHSCGSQAPIGYKIVDRKFVIDESRAPFIKRAFEAYADGVPKKKIIAELNAAGLRNREGKPYGITALQTALRNPKYIGTVQWDDIVVEDACPALIDRETFERVQERLKQNRRQGGKNKSDEEFLLSGKLYCGKCGETMSGTSGRGRHGGMHYYYCCHGRRKYRICSKAHERKEFLERYVVEKTVSYVLTPKCIQTIAESIVAEYEKEFGSDQIKALERQIAKLNRDLDKYTEMLLDMPPAARSRVYDKMESAELQKADLEIDLSKLRIANQIHYTKEEIVAWLNQFCKGNVTDKDFKKRIIDTFINTIYVYDNRVVIFYNIRGNQPVTYADMLKATENIHEPDISSEISENPNIIEESEPIRGVRILNDMVRQKGFEPPTFWFVENLEMCHCVS